MEEKIPNKISEEDGLASIIGRNITRLRKMSNMTQLELAEKLNYSDKSVSKWEQGNGIPDVRILVQLAELFSVSLDDLVREPKRRLMPKRERRIKRTLGTLILVGLCWFLAVGCFVALMFFAPSVSFKWLAFLYAVPASAIVLLVVSSVWKLLWGRIVSVSVLIWTALTCIFLTFFACGYNVWYVFFIGIPPQILAPLYFVGWKPSRFFNP